MPVKRVVLERSVPFLVAALFIVLGRIPGIIAPPWDIDEGLYATAGQAIARGEFIYHDLWDNKPPAIYFLFSWISSFNSDYVAFRIVGTCFLIATAGVIYYLALRTLSPVQARQSLAIFSILAAVPIFETHISNAEIFFLLPTSLAILLTAMIEFRKWARPNYVLVGVMLACGLLFKIVVLFDALAILTWLVFRHGRDIKAQLMYLALGVAAILTPPAIYLIRHDLLVDFVRAAFLDNLGYVGQGNAATLGFLGMSYPWLTVLLKTAILVAALSTVWQAHRHRLGPVTLFYLWLIWTSFGALLSGRPYLHYLIAAMGAVALLAPILWQKVWPPSKWPARGLRRWSKAVASLSILAAVLVLGFGGMAQFVSTTPETTRVASGYYLMTQKYLSGKMSRDDYVNFFGDTVALNFKVADYLRDHSEPTDHIFIWGNAPWVYYFSQRPHSSRYLVAYQLTFVHGAKQEILNELTSAPPAFIVVTNEPEMFARAGSPTPHFPQLLAFVRAHYALKTSIGRVEIYERKAWSDLTFH